MKNNTLSTIAVILLAILATAAVAIALTLLVHNDATPAEEPVIEAPVEEPTPVEEAAPAKTQIKIFSTYNDTVGNWVNEWLAANPDVEIISIQSSAIDQHRTTVMVVYAEK